ncbi:hypothetical protein CS542_08375 [Pedobacter sp. IW39]|nr:hypothetical protein CS542_08375 [Pedobacter sp. IW39]
MNIQVMKYLQYLKYLMVILLGVINLFFPNRFYVSYSGLVEDGQGNCRICYFNLVSTTAPTIIKTLTSKLVLYLEI